MLKNYDETEVMTNRVTFLAEGKCPSTGVREEVLASWEKCRERRLDAKTTVIKTLPTISEGEKLPNPIMSFLRDDILPDITKLLYQLLQECQGALFWVYQRNAIVFSQRGNQDFLRQLNQHNIGIGTCLSEEYIGTTAFSLVDKPHEESWVIGHEHYLDLLTPYATYTYYQEDFYGHSYAFIIVPKEAFTDGLLSYFRLFNKARESTIRCYRNSLESDLKSELFNQLSEARNEAVIFIDSFGKIVDANQKFSKWVNVEKAELKDKELTEVLPEMQRILSCLETGKTITSEEIQLSKLPPHMQFVQMDVKPIESDKKITGLIIILMDNKTFRQRMSKISNQAYYTFDQIIGESGALQEAKQRAMNAACSSSNVILSGESGTGKELFAQAIHKASPRREGPFVSINCAAIPTELIASELFGYVEGAFTGARKGGSMGKFEYANTGTIFLDEIGEMPLHIQTILLRVLEERRVNRIGSNIATPVDVRLICATNRNLHKMVKDGSFRLDLYYRINVLHIHLPPLRERITDIPIIVDYYLDYFNRFLDKKVREVAPETMAFLINHSWEGNLRELRNTIECGINNAMGKTLELEHLPRYFFEKEEKMFDDREGSLGHESVYEFEEKKKMLALMIKFNGNKSAVAEEIGISRSTLYRKLKSYNLL
ncbi:PAS modulated Fis family sigma54 specific transcriptional regulator [Desulfitobacterium sp. LBE]|uniref:Sigma54 specific transcriptional regulator, Fis family n=2 Tax=root TaxID=1 RepID=B8G0V4_DESHD|nr:MULTISPECIES: sigma 54-interacting transcriptional regulator [Desulfitobacterium]ACL18373.1 sigma54 specific transcriptional regulator, Fis family [Desulfitobacterium hafniense DCB-2]MEA5023661.1 sigma 54-interacting transcriptional regulator [Desulfitobacterium hafniense]TWH58699.1 PAS modulated Fis family sigma54 specific transcriptional regulator [Desulfitobacterium sp. LBE]